MKKIVCIQWYINTEMAGINKPFLVEDRYIVNTMNVDALEMQAAK